jgi:antitoxin YefM
VDQAVSPGPECWQPERDVDIERWGRRAWLVDLDPKCAVSVGCGRRTSSGCTSCSFLVILVTMSETRSLADVKAHLSELVAKVGAQHDRVTVTVHGRPTAVLVAVEDLESLEETIAVLSDKALRVLADAGAELAAGAGESETDLRAAMDARRTRR